MAWRFRAIDVEVGLRHLEQTQGKRRVDGVRERETKTVKNHTGAREPLKCTRGPLAPDGLGRAARGYI